MVMICIAAALLLTQVDSALAKPDTRYRDVTRGPQARPLSHRSKSQGYPWRGRLRKGVKLMESPYIRYTTEYARQGDNFYGTWELVQLVERAAWRVHQRLPGAKLSVGELSARQGGPIPGHHSHQNGRDVDIAFYMLDAHDKPYAPFAFAAFNGQGRGLKPNQMLRFDRARNWELIARLVVDGDARVQYIFVANRIKRLLLREAKKRRAPAAVIRRADRLMVQPAKGHKHRNHFHLRIYCPPNSRPACQDRAPFHRWYPGRPPR